MDPRAGWDGSYLHHPAAMPGRWLLQWRLPSHGVDDETRTPGWRTIIAALFALGVLGAVIWAGWGVLSEQLSEGGGETPDLAVDRFLVGVNEGREDGLRDTAAGDPEVFFTTLEEAVEPLSAREVTASVDRVAEDGARADAVLTWTVVGGPADGASWTSSLVLERRRGRWDPVLDRSTVHPQLREGWTFRVESQEASRTAILDADGVSLTASGSAVTLGIEPRAVVSEDRLLNAWVATLPDSYEDLEELLSRRDLRPTWFYPVTTISQARFDDVWPQLRAIPGVISRDGQDTSADSPFAIHVLGRAGEPTAEMVADGATEGEITGLYGLEAVYDDRLVSGAASRIVIVEADGDVHDELVPLFQDDEDVVQTTLLARVQQAAEDAVLGIDGNLAIVAVDTDDGAVRASLSRPITGYNRAFEGQYTPGDAAVAVVLDALVDAGVGMGTSVTCPAEDVVAGAQLTAPRPDDDTTVAEAVAQGCDTTLGALAADLDDDTLVDAAARLGFGVAFDLPLATSTSSWPEPADTTERVRAATGQARVLSSPLHVASTLAGAVSGVWRPPYLMVDEEPGEGRPLATGTGGAMAEVLRAAPELAEVPSLVGTAERPADGSRVTDAWGLAVVDDLAVVVLVEDTGDATAARDLLERLLTELT